MNIDTDSRKTDLFGPNTSNLETLVERYSRIKWYQNLGGENDQNEIRDLIHKFTSNFDVEDYRIKRLSKEQLPEFLEGMKLEASPLWNSLNQIPIKMKEAMGETGRDEHLNYINDTIPEQVFHGAFDGAFEQLEQYGEETISFFTGAAMYITTLASAWEILGDLEEWQSNHFIPLIEIVEKGHLPLGLYENRFYYV
ncbi:MULTISPECIES: hypothetical protein [Bacillaceae]|uniref:Uncharacterized protein n=1 Tax=Evansella alkalicola TaxID=745819 RepID=A0ABS6JX78_9BACI|nr:MULTISPECIES: hypothetical protein [Bacillaceae]MBU9723193.1 hypothetical protein [Bacillus alkalicola]